MQEPPMTPQEKAAVMQFMGQTYGEAHKQDQNILQQSGNLSPNSGQLKQVFEQTAKMPTVARPYQQAPPQQEEQPPEALPVQVAPISPEQAAQELQQQATPPPLPDPVEQPSDQGQLDLDFSEPSKADKIIKMLEKQNLILNEISLKLDNGKSVKTNKQK